MFNTQLNQQYNLSTYIPTAEDMGAVMFNNFNFYSLCQNKKYGVIIKRDNFHDLENIELDTFSSALSDGGGIINKKYGLKDISMTVLLITENNNDMVTLIDELKQKLQGVNGDLDILLNGQYRTYKATLESIRFPSMDRKTSFVPDVEIGFKITSGTWYVKEPTSYTYQSVIGARPFNVTNAGTREVYPKIKFAFKNTGNAITQINLEIKKYGNATGNTLYITEAIGNDDILIFDYANSSVTLNGDEIQFYNPMTPLFVGINVIDFTLTGTISADVTIEYNKNYL